MVERSPRTWRSRRRGLRGPGTYLDGYAIWVVALHPVAVVIAKRCLRIIAYHANWLVTYMYFSGLAANERVLNDRIWWCLRYVSELLALLEDFLSGPDIDCERDEDNEPRRKLLVATSRRISLIEPYQTGP